MFIKQVLIQSHPTLKLRMAKQSPTRVKTLAPQRLGLIFSGFFDRVDLASFQFKRLPARINSRAVIILKTEKLYGPGNKPSPEGGK